MDSFKSICDHLKLTPPQRTILKSELRNICGNEQDHEPQPELWKGRDLRKEWLELYRKIQG